MPSVQPRVLTNGLASLVAEADAIYITSSEAGSFAEAVTTFALGFKNFGVGNIIGPPAPASPNGEKVTTAAVTDGVVTGTGTAAFWAIVDSVNLRLGATGTISPPQVVTAGNKFTLPQFDITLSA
jgi:hypothetical protein